jgi:hypothetical protein
MTNIGKITVELDVTTASFSSVDRKALMNMIIEGALPDFHNAKGKLRAFIEVLSILPICTPAKAVKVANSMCGTKITLREFEEWLPLAIRKYFQEVMK